MLDFLTIPANFNMIKIYPIIKNEAASWEDISNLRPITVSDVISNIFERFVLLRIRDNWRINELQCGFRQNCGCSNALFCLREAIAYQKRIRKPLYACALDYSKDFDNLNRSVMFERLRDILAPPLWMIYKKYYEQSIAVVYNDGETSDYFKVRNSTKQGGPASPEVFAISIEPMIEIVKEKSAYIDLDGLKLGPLLYADHTIILADE